MEYLNFVGVNPDSWSDNPLYMSFGKRISNIAGKAVDLNSDADVQTLYMTALLPLMLVT